MGDVVRGDTERPLALELSCIAVGRAELKLFSTHNRPAATRCVKVQGFDESTRPPKRRVYPDLFDPRPANEFEDLSIREALEENGDMASAFFPLDQARRCALASWVGGEVDANSCVARAFVAGIRDRLVCEVGTCLLLGHVCGFDTGDMVSSRPAEPHVPRRAVADPGSRALGDAVRRSRHEGGEALEQVARQP